LLTGSALSASIIPFTPSTKVMSVVIFDLKKEGQFGAVAVSFCDSPRP